MKLVNIFKSAAQGYGTEKRVLLLHGPVGSSKRTIARLLKKGLEDYSQTPEGALYTFAWDVERVNLDGQKRARSCPARCTRSRCTSSRTSCAPSVLAELVAAGAAATPIPVERRPLPGLPLRLQRADDRVRAATGRRS